MKTRSKFSPSKKEEKVGAIATNVMISSPRYEIDELLSTR
jgi:hypothetical protein